MILILNKHMFIFNINIVQINIKNLVYFFIVWIFLIIIIKNNFLVYLYYVIYYFYMYCVSPTIYNYRKTKKISQLNKHSVFCNYFSYMYISVTYCHFD